MQNLEELLFEEFAPFPYKLKFTICNDVGHDYQANINAITMAGKLDELTTFINANDVLTKLFTTEFVSVGETSKFICFTIKKEYTHNILDMFNKNNDEFELIKKVSTPKTILYDYSSPNMAKDMHVGHLRSTILGDCLANISEFLGNTVLRINHLGDFGLPFGMIIEYVISNGIIVDETTSLQQLYILAKSAFDSDDDFKQKAYIRTKELQLESDDHISVKQWNLIFGHSLKSYQKVYELLNISPKLTVMGESFYVKYIDEVKSLLDDAEKTKVDDEGKTVVNITGLIPLIYMKSGERGSAYTYDTTDIATLWYRITHQCADNIYYVVDNGQSLHFKQLIKLGDEMGWTVGKTVEHINFGVITGSNKQRIKSRSGDTPKLMDLINDGIDVTTESFIKRKLGSELTDDERETIKNVAIGSIKYYDMTRCRTTSYQFNFDEMLRYEGNTYTYLIYSIARCRGVIENFKKEIPDDLKFNPDELSLEDYKVMKKINYFPSIIKKAFDTQMPHHLCDYVHKLSASFHENYTNTRCLHFDEDKKLVSYNQTRIIMYMLVSKILKVSCLLLGVPIINKI